jgi:hypothetical protein
MDSETFTASTLEEAKKMVARWLSHHKVTVKKEHAPLEVRQSAGRFATKAEGKIISVSIRIDYEDPCSSWAALPRGHGHFPDAHNRCF